jgi:hypothetical protein
VYTVSDGDGHSDTMDEYSERGEYYYAEDVNTEVARLEGELEARTSLLMACLSPIEDEFPVTEKNLTDCIKSVLNGEPAQDAVSKYLLEKERSEEG